MMELISISHDFHPLDRHSTGLGDLPLDHLGLLMPKSFMMKVNLSPHNGLVTMSAN